MKKFRLALLALLGVTGAALLQTEPAKKVACGCALPPQPTSESRFMSVMTSVSKTLRQAVSLRALALQAPQDDPNGYCTLSFTRDRMLWNTEAIAARKVDAPLYAASKQV